MILHVIKHLLILTSVKLPLQLVGIPIMLVYFRFFNDESRIRLPKYLKWFGVWEHKSYGINGDDAWRRAHDYTKWYPRFKYNVLRNPLNHFQWEVLGKDNITDIDNLWNVFRLGTVYTTNDLGWAYTKMYELDRLHAWEFYCLLKYPFTSKAFRVRLGYKIMNIEDLDKGPKFQWAFSVTPFKRIRQ